MRSHTRITLLVGLLSAVLPCAGASAQTAFVRIHSLHDTTEFYTAITYLGFHESGDPEEHFGNQPGWFNLKSNKSYRIARVVATDQTGKLCILTKNSDGGLGFTTPGPNDTLDVNVQVDFKFCQYYISPNYRDGDEGARGTIRFQASKSWTPSFLPNGVPTDVTSGEIDFFCALDGDKNDCNKGSDIDKALAYGANVTVTYSPSPGNRVAGPNPFGGWIDGAPGEAITLNGTADKLLHFDNIIFATVHHADGSVALTASAVHDTVATATFQVHNGGPDSAVFRVFASGTTVVRAGAGHVAKTEVTTPLGSCVQTDYPCNSVGLRSGASATVTVTTTTARLNDGSSAAVGANNCATLTITGEADSQSANNTAPCVTGGGTVIAVAAGGSPPANQTVAVGSTNVPVLQFTINPPVPTTLDGITLIASGSGNDNINITAVKLYVDANANGIVDASESALASGTFPSNNGTVTLAVSPVYAFSAQKSFLVTYDFNTTLASRYGGVIVLAGLLPVFMLPRRRRRGIAGVVVLALGLGVASMGLGACGGDSTSPNPSPGGSMTFTAQLTGVTAAGAAVSGVSVPGATVTVAR